MALYPFRLAKRKTLFQSFEARLTQSVSVSMGRTNHLPCIYAMFILVGRRYASKFIEVKYHVLIIVDYHIGLGPDLP